MRRAGRRYGARGGTEEQLRRRKGPQSPVALAVEEAAGRCETRVEAVEEVGGVVMAGEREELVGGPGAPDGEGGEPQSEPPGEGNETSVARRGRE